MVVNSGREDLVSIVKRETGGLGVDRVIVAASGKQAIEDALRIVIPAGKIGIFAGTYPHQHRPRFRQDSLWRDKAHRNNGAYSSSLRAGTRAH